MNSGVSVIIPAYNIAGCLRRAVDSALEQNPAPLEVIVINDGSNDRTPEVARSFGQKIVYLEQSNQGQGAARNLGLRSARGEFVAFLDADDFWLPGFLAACMSFLREHPEAIAVSTGARIQEWDNKSVLMPSVLASPVSCPSAPTVLGDFFEFWGEHDHIRTGTTLIRREIIEHAGHQQANLRISQDLEYWGYLATFGKWGFIPQVLWVGDSEGIASVNGGWLRKYRQRRKLCPTVEQWQERIVPRLKPEDWPGFRKVRGRVAACFAHNLVLGGRSSAACDIVSKYGQEMPRSWSSCVLRLGRRTGGGGWWVACLLLRSREYFKAVMMSLRRIKTVTSIR